MLESHIMGSEQRAHYLDTGTQRTRDRLKRPLSIPFKTEHDAVNSGFIETSEHIKKGGGLIVYANHFDRPDPLHVLFALYDIAPSFSTSEIIVPIADHQKMDGIRLIGLSQRAGITIKPIVTERSAKKNEAKIEKLKRGSFFTRIGPFQTTPQITDLLIREFPPEGTGLREFSETATEGLINGKIVYIPTQPERSAQINTPAKKERSLGRLAAAVRKLKIENVGILFAGVYLNESTDHSKKSGMNLFRTHHVTFGSFYTLEDAILEAGKDGVDAWAVEQNITDLVPEGMVSDKLKFKLAQNGSKSEEKASSGQGF